MSLDIVWVGWVGWGYNLILIDTNPIRVNLISWFLLSQVPWNVWRLSGNCLRGVWGLSEWLWILSGGYDVQAIDKHSMDYYTTGWSKATVNCNFSLADLNISKSAITQWFLEKIYHLRNTLTRIQTPNSSRVITCMLSDTLSRHLCVSQDANKTTRKQQMQKDIPTRQKCCLRMSGSACWHLLVSLGVCGWLWVSVSVCWCFVLSRYVLKMPWEVIRRYLSAFFGCLWSLDVSERLSNVQPS